MRCKREPERKWLRAHAMKRLCRLSVSLSARGRESMQLSAYEVVSAYDEEIMSPKPKRKRM